MCHVTQPKHKWCRPIMVFYNLNVAARPLTDPHPSFGKFTGYMLHLREHVKKNFAFSLSKDKCLECSETKEYAKILFCKGIR